MIAMALGACAMLAGCKNPVDTRREPTDAAQARGRAAIQRAGLRLKGDVILESTVGEENMDSATIGAGATVLENLRLGDNCTIGAGAVVTEDVQGNATVVGVPARLKRA